MFGHSIREFSRVVTEVCLIIAYMNHYLKNLRFKALNGVYHLGYRNGVNQYDNNIGIGVYRSNLMTATTWRLSM